MTVDALERLGCIVDSGDIRKMLILQSSSASILEI